MSAILVSVSLTQMVCPECGGVYAIADAFLEESRKVGDLKKCWTCPYCKTQRGYGKGRLEELRQEVERLKQEKQSAEFRADLHRQSSERQRRKNIALKGTLTKERNRVGNGVCPCCNRSFANLRRHMATKHPEHGPSCEARDGTRARPKAAGHLSATAASEGACAPRKEEKQ